MTIKSQAQQSDTAFSRRALLGAGLGSVVISALPLSAQAGEAEFIAARDALFGDRPVREGRVTIKLPPIAENGNSVPVTVTVDSPMTEADHVTRIVILSPRNPVATLAEFKLGPETGLAKVATRVRLGGTQKVQAIAEMSDGTLWSGSYETVVTLAACIIL